jgi:hypothetical protein
VTSIRRFHAEVDDVLRGSAGCSLFEREVPMSAPLSVPISQAKRRLTVAADEPGSLDRHPDDGWRLAEPIRVGRATQKVLRAMIGALLPPPPAPRTPEIEETIFCHVLVLLQYMAPATARGFLLLLHVLNWSPLWRFVGLRPLTAIAPARASAVLKGIAGSRFLVIRMMMLAPKGLILSTYFDQDAIHSKLDCDPRGFTQERIALRKRLVAGDTARAEDHIHHVAKLS